MSTQEPQSRTATIVGIDHQLLMAANNAGNTLTFDSSSSSTPNLIKRPGSSILHHYSSANSRANETKSSIESSPFAPLGSRARRRGSLQNDTTSITTATTTRFQQRENPVKVLAQCSAGSSKLPPIRVDFGGPLSCEVDVRSPSHFGNTTQNRLAEWNREHQQQQQQQQQQIDTHHEKEKTTTTITTTTSPPNSRKSGTPDRNNYKKSPSPNNIEAENDQDDLRWEERRRLINNKLFDFGPQSTIFRKLFLAEDVKTRQREEFESKAQRRREQVLIGRVPPPEDMPPIPEEIAMEVGLRDVIEIEKEQWKRWSSGETGHFDINNEEFSGKRKHNRLHQQHQQQQSPVKHKARTLGPSPSRTRYIEAIRFMKEHERKVAEEEKHKMEDDEKKRAMMALREVTHINLASIESPDTNYDRNNNDKNFDDDDDDDDDEEEDYNYGISAKKNLFSVITSSKPVDDDEKQQPIVHSVGFKAKLEESQSDISRNKQIPPSSPHATFILDDNAKKNDSKTFTNDSFFSGSGSGYARPSQLEDAAKKVVVVNNDSTQNTMSMNFQAEDSDLSSHDNDNDDDDDDFAHHDMQKIAQLAAQQHQQQPQRNTNNSSNAVVSVAPSMMKRVESSILRTNSGGSNARKREVTLFTPDLDDIPHYDSFSTIDRKKLIEDKAICAVMGANFVYKDSDDDGDEEQEVAVVSKDGKVTMVKKKKKDSSSPSPATKKSDSNSKTTKTDVLVHHEDSGSGGAPLQLDASLTFSARTTNNPSGFYFLGANALHKRENRELFGEFADEIIAIEEADEANRVADDEDGAPTLAKLPPTYSAMVMNLLKTVHLSRPEIQQRGLARTMQQRGCEENVKRRKKNDEEIESGEQQQQQQQHNITISNNISFNHNHHNVSTSTTSPSTVKKSKPATTPVISQRELRNKSILEEALNDLNQVSANAYIDEVTDKAIFFRHALLSEKKARAGLFDDPANPGSSSKNQHRPLILNSHSIRKKAGALTGLFGEKNGGGSNNNNSTASTGNGNFSRETVSSSQQANKKQQSKSFHQMVLRSDFTPSKMVLKQRRNIPIGTELEIGGVRFLYDEFMRQ